MPKPVVIHETVPAGAVTPFSRAIAEVAKALKQAGFESIEIPSSWTRESDAEKTLRKLAHRPMPVTAVLCGYVHTSDDYSELYAALAAKNLMLVNSPAEYVRCLSFAAAYPHLRGLTPESIIVRDVSEVAAAAWRLGFPLFIKGAVQSRKDKGWSACVANSVQEAETHVAGLLNAYTYSEGAAILRKLVKLRHQVKRQDGFPIAREFRVILYQDVPLGVGHYWPEEDPLSELTAEEHATICELAVKASQQLRVPYLAVDIAQQESGAWTVIETGDPQTSGFAKIEVEKCIARLAEKLGAANPTNQAT
ncbi:MAG: hypothetical protein K0Q55_3993 [Verrucomicrobia bacterium]|nr:hypothetical protein [Verrucomicrobiota bacterium]